MGELNYFLSGSVRRPTILFLHGFMGSSEDWRSVMAALDERYRCLAVDLPGHGASLVLTPEDYTVEGATRVLLTLPDELDIERPALVGYSMGGRLGLHFALRHPDRCAKLFLGSASPGIEDAAERQPRRRADEEKARRLESGDLETFLADWCRQPLFTSLAQHEELVEAMIEIRSQNDPGELARSLRGMGAGRGPSLWGELAALQAPTLSVAGKLDRKFIRISRRMAGSSPNIHVTEVPRAGHNVRAEVPEAYLALLRRFLDTL